jgi:peptidoglycan/xylan/chitin deacetylase (PgdA/CDA1 family)
MRSWTLGMLCAAVYFTGLLWLGVRVRRLFGGGRPRVLCYHRVARDGRPGTLHTERFARHLGHLKANYRFVAPSTIAKVLKEGASLPVDSVGVTFDDGYRDLLDEALPLLRREGVTAGFFVLTAHLPGRGALFLDRIRGTAMEAERKALASLASSERERRLADLPAVDAPALMDAEDIRRLVAEGQEVGSHGRTHGLLPALPPGEAEAEIRESRKELLRHASHDAQLFAYPWGAHREEDRRMAREAGYSAAYSGEWVGVRKGGDPFAIPRVNVPGDASVARLACEAAGFVEWLRSLVR